MKGIINFHYRLEIIYSKNVWFFQDFKKIFFEEDNTYPQWQSLPHTLEDPGEGVQEQKMPSSSSRFLTFLVRYIS